MINLNQLRALYCVVKTGTFAKAAEELCVTEPAVYIQVRSLERDMGFTLLDRFGKELHPMFSQGLELGRSFIIEEYQRHRLSSFLMWQVLTFNMMS